MEAILQLNVFIVMAALALLLALGLVFWAKVYNSPQRRRNRVRRKTLQLCGAEQKLNEILPAHQEELMRLEQLTRQLQIEDERTGRVQRVEVIAALQESVDEMGRYVSELETESDRNKKWLKKHKVTFGEDDRPQDDAVSSTPQSVDEWFDEDDADDQPVVRQDFGDTPHATFDEDPSSGEWRVDQDDPTPPTTPMVQAMKRRDAAERELHGSTAFNNERVHLVGTELPNQAPTLR